MGRISLQKVLYNPIVSSLFDTGVEEMVLKKLNCFFNTICQMIFLKFWFLSFFRCWFVVFFNWYHWWIVQLASLALEN